VDLWSFSTAKNHRTASQTPGGDRQKRTPRTPVAAAAKPTIHSIHLRRDTCIPAQKRMIRVKNVHIQTPKISPRTLANAQRKLPPAVVDNSVPACSHGERIANSALSCSRLGQTADSKLWWKEISSTKATWRNSAIRRWPRIPLNRGPSHAPGIQHDLCLGNSPVFPPARSLRLQLAARAPGAEPRGKRRLTRVHRRTL